MTKYLFCSIFLFPVFYAMRQVHVQLLNRCNTTLWPGMRGKVTNDFEFTEYLGKLEIAATNDIFVPTGWNGQIWAKTHCSPNMVCGTGTPGIDEKPLGPVTSAFFNFNRAGSDYYYVSLVDGHNIPVTIEPLNSTAKKNCTIAGGCSGQLNLDCPEELRYAFGEEVIGCMSACQKFQNDRYCCKGGFDSMFECNDRSWPYNYPLFFKKHCPKALTFKYDWENNPIYSCYGAGANTTYQVRFC